MKICLLTPTRNFLEMLKPEFEKLGHQVSINRITGDCEVILGMSISQIQNIKNAHRLFPSIPMILYNWDWYDHLDKTKGDWKEFADLMRESIDVWSASEITAIKCERDTGIKSSRWFYAYILPDEWPGDKRDGGYLLQASRQDSYKRFDWFERAAKELGIPFKSYHPNVNSRPDYIQAVKNCSILVVSSREESLGTLSAMEAAYCGKPVIIADFEGAKEVWVPGTAHFFPKDNFEAYKALIQDIWNRRNTDVVFDCAMRGQSLISSEYTPSRVAEKMSQRLSELFK